MDEFLEQFAFRSQFKGIVFNDGMDNTLWVLIEEFTDNPFEGKGNGTFQVTGILKKKNEWIYLSDAQYAENGDEALDKAINTVILFAAKEFYL